jgi:hypothetical protein
MANQPSSVAELPWLALDTYREEYRDLSETWRSFDAKAQATGAIAGIFLAALFAWAREMPASLGTQLRVLVVASIVLLVASIIAAVLALQVRRVAAPPLGEAAAEMVRDILHKQRPEELPDRLVRLCNDQIGLWKATNRDMTTFSESKASRIGFAQGALLLAAVLVAILSIVVVLRPTG